MVEETITQIEARIQKAQSLNDERKKELLDLLSTLRTEVSHLSKTDAEDARSIAGFTTVATVGSGLQYCNSRIGSENIGGRSCGAGLI